MIPFNKPYLTGKEVHYIYQAVSSGKLSGNGIFTKLCQDFFRDRYNFGKCLLTSSCTDALEMAAILCNIQPGDEVIMPSYTFVSTANAFVLRGARIVFADSRKDHPGIDEEVIETLINERTKVIVPVHYAGIACDMEKIMRLADRYGLIVVEDAAQAIDNYYLYPDKQSKALGSIGNMSTFSFHETKNIISGEGGMLVVNDENLFNRAEIIWEKGTNRSAYFRGEIDKYGWVDIGSSFLPSELTAAFLWAQIEHMDQIQTRRKEIWTKYYTGLSKWASENSVRLPVIPDYSGNNAHMFYMIFNSIQDRQSIIDALRKNDVLSVFHYIGLHSSPFYNKHYIGGELRNCDYYTDCLLRLPFYYELQDEQQEKVIMVICNTRLH